MYGLNRVDSLILYYNMIYKYGTYVLFDDVALIFDKYFYKHPAFTASMQAYIK